MDHPQRSFYGNDDRRPSHIGEIGDVLSADRKIDNTVDNGGSMIISEKAMQIIPPMPSHGDMPRSIRLHGDGRDLYRTALQAEHAQSVDRWNADGRV